MSIGKKIQKIPCGGFEFDDSLEIRDGKLSAKSALDKLAVPTLHITVTSLDMSTKECTVTADKTPDEMLAVHGPSWCIVTIPASVSPSGSEMVLNFSPCIRGFEIGYGVVIADGGHLVSAVGTDGRENWYFNFKAAF